MRTFRDRVHAGRQLAEQLGEYARSPDTVVLGLPRGGVPVGAEVARALQLPLDVLIVRKVGAPGQEELAVGAIASGGATVWNEDLVGLFPESALQAILARQREELARREALYRGKRAPLNVQNRTAILVDDGAATGASMRVAVQALRSLGARKIIVALPVASDSALALLRTEADEVRCALEPPHFDAVGQWYQNFAATTDGEVITLLQQAYNERHRSRRE